MDTDGLPTDSEHKIVEGQEYQVARIETAGGRTLYYLQGQPNNVCWSATRFVEVDAPPATPKACPVKEET